MVVTYHLNVKVPIVATEANGLLTIPEGVESGLLRIRGISQCKLEELWVDQARCDFCSRVRSCGSNIDVGLVMQIKPMTSVRKLLRCAQASKLAPERDSRGPSSA
jgi:hypothetical protein